MSCSSSSDELEPFAGFEQKDLARGHRSHGVLSLSAPDSEETAPARRIEQTSTRRWVSFSSCRAASWRSWLELQRREALKRNFEDPPAPLFHEVRELVLGKCTPEKRQEIRAIFEKQPFGELERLVTQKLLDVIKRVAREELKSEKWLHSVARLSGRSYKQMRVVILEFLDTDVFHVSLANCVSFLDPLIESWDIDLSDFAMQIVLNRRLVPGHSRRFEFVETESGPTFRRRVRAERIPWRYFTQP